MLKMSKKVVSVILVVIMVCSVFTVVPFTVSAASSTQEYVGDARVCHYEYIDYNNNKVDVTYKIPKILINSNDIDAVNEEISQKYEEKFINAQNCVALKSWELQYTELDYEYYVYRDILSVLIFYKYPNNNFVEYSVYNFDIESGKRLFNQEIANKLSIDYSAIKSSIVSAINNSFSVISGFGTDEFVNQQYQKSISDENIEYSCIYIGENNQLFAMYRIYWIAGAEVYYRLLPITTLDDVDDKKFVCNKDGNRFTHSDGVTIDGKQLNDNGIYGFYNVNNYEINSPLIRAKILSAASSETEMSYLLEAMESEWIGSCYGLASVIGLTFLGEISLDDISDSKVDNFYSLTRPCENRKLLDAIEYYHLSQCLKKFGMKSEKCVSTYFDTFEEILDTFKGIINNSNLANVKSNDEFYKSLIQAVKENYMVLLGYSEKDGGGHTVLTCGLEENGNEYRIKIYDENDRIDFDELLITNNNGKFSATYKCTSDQNEDLMSELVEMDYMPLSALYEIQPFSSNKTVESVGANQTMTVTLPVTNKFKIINGSGEYLTYDGSNLNGNLEIYNIYNIHDSEKTKMQLEIRRTDAIEYIPLEESTDISIFDDSNYYSLSATNIDEVKIDLENSISVKGTNYKFKAGLNQNVCGEVEVISFAGNSNGKTSFVLNDNNEISMKADEEVRNLSVDLITPNDKTNITENEHTNEFVVSNKIQIGDVNFDRKISVDDATDIQKYLASMITFSSTQESVADADGDGKIGISDVTEIQKYLAGLQSVLKDNTVGGDEDYTKIYTTSDFYNIENNLSGKYILMNDISFELSPPPSIGTFDNPFTGVLDGNGYTITLADGNAFITKSSYYRGLFGYTNGAEIKNLKITGEMYLKIITADSGCANYCGAIVGFAKNTAFNNCSNSTDITSSANGHRDLSVSAYAYAGGIAGWCDGGSITNCSNFGTIKAFSDTNLRADAASGGMSGVCSGTTIKNCNNAGYIYSNSITSSSKYWALAYSGGLIGQSSSCSMSGCSNSGMVESKCLPKVSTSYNSVAASGGLIGYGKINYENCTANINDIAAENNSYSTKYSGQFIGYTS